MMIKLKDKFMTFNFITYKIQGIAVNFKDW